MSDARPGSSIPKVQHVATAAEIKRRIVADTAAKLEDMSETTPADGLPPSTPGTTITPALITSAIPPASSPTSTGGVSPVVVIAIAAVAAVFLLNPK